MKAKIVNPGHNINGRAHRKEKHYTGEIVAIDRKTGESTVVLRLYSTDAVSYACLWIGNGEVHASGSGKATGGNYHKPSAAAAAAIASAGIELSEDIDGRGEQSIVEAVRAIAKALKIRNPIIHTAHA